MSDSFGVVSETVLAELGAVLATYGSALHGPAREGAPPRGRWIMASIGCCGQAARGALTFVAAPSFWRGIAAATEDATLPEPMLSDLAGEVANMVMGRTRNRLLKVGLEIHQATPTCAFGDAIVLSDPGEARSTWHGFVTACGDVHVRIDAWLDPSLDLRPGGEHALEPLEQDLVLF